MRILFLASVGFLLLLSLPDDVIACTCKIQSTKKAFRESEAVFVGRVVASQKLPTNDEEDYPFRIKLKVYKSWKGSQKKFVTIRAAFPNKNLGMCGAFEFENDKEYIVFAKDKRLKVATECSNSAEVSKYADYYRNSAEKLDSFWFRTWARIYPF